MNSDTHKELTSHYMSNTYSSEEREVIAKTFDELVEEMGTPMVIRLAESFQRNLQPIMQNLKRDMERGNRDALRESAHQIKGSIPFWGARQVKNQAMELVALACNEDIHFDKVSEKTSELLNNIEYFDVILSEKVKQVIKDTM